MISLTQKEMQDVLNCVMLTTTEQMAGIPIKLEDSKLSEDVCTVNTIFEGNCDLTLSLCGDTSFFIRLTQGVLQESSVSPQDVEDTAKEYLNVICGRLIAQVFPLKYRPTRFHFPQFQTGKHMFCDKVEYTYVSYYINEYGESILLVLALSMFPQEHKQ